MPLVDPSAYPGPPWYQFNGHLQTIVPSVTRRFPDLPYERERLELPDGDFLDLDWLPGREAKLVILSHGLEGNSQRTYVRGMADYFHRRGWEVLAWNCRSCSEEMNRTPRLYYHGDVEDIGTVVEHAVGRRSYERVTLIGFSMGGAMTLKYLGVKGQYVPAPIDSAVAFSVPCDLGASSATLDLRSNRFYRNRFFTRLQEKLRRKEAQFPGLIDVSLFEKVKVWRDFDVFFSAPINGFSSAEEFYYHSSALNFMEGIAVPTLLVNAENDPILTPSCHPRRMAQNHPYLYLEVPHRGGHVGFFVPRSSVPWSEERAWCFVQGQRYQ